MSEIATYFARKKDIKVHLILYGITREIFYKIPDNIIIHKPSFRFNDSIRLLSTLRTLVYLRFTIKKINPSSILSFGEYWNSFLLLSIYGLDYQTFISDRSQPDKSLGRLHDWLRRKLYPKAKGLILQTEKARDIFLLKNSHPNIVVIGNPVREFNPARFPEVREKSILMVGRLIKTKHQDKLIEMFANVRLPEWKLIIVGYDHLKQHNLARLRELARISGIEDQVVFTGKQENMEEIYCRSSFFAFTSSSEGFPNVIGEAMAAGLPVVAFDCVAGPSELITDGRNGYLIPLFDYELFQSRMAELMNNEKLRQELGFNARVSIEKFSSEKICEAFFKFIVQ
jgi:GalNAc-alpha-(1->4)-GalNAc-alpha-(1->3)-diNAcBac-PP-undecaprenol alpha-1,4-N-acetyl-D-galactosaminyltransferase